MTLERRIVNQWVRDGDAPVRRAQILRQDVHPEGLDVTRFRFDEEAQVPLFDGAHLISVIRGTGTVVFDQDYALREGVHVFVPGAAPVVGHPGSELIVVSGAPSQARIDRVVVRDENYVRGCATDDGPLRWVLTPQYLSRRLFLHHDAVLSSKSGRPVSWFRTTMFDTNGLPPNDDGESVFKMSYDHRTEPNFCYEVDGEARVRFAERPYEDNRWGPWLPLDGETTYHLNEPEGCPRNKHEVAAHGGHATLFCLFDPAPTGVEQHKTGAYSSYGPLDAILGTPRHEAVLEAHKRFDPMLDELSIRRAQGRASYPPEMIRLHGRGLRAQMAYEETVLNGLSDDRRAVVERWATSV